MLCILKHDEAVKIIRSGFEFRFSWFSFCFQMFLNMKNVAENLSKIILLLYFFETTMSAQNRQTISPFFENAHPV